MQGEKKLRELPALPCPETDLPDCRNQQVYSNWSNCTYIQKIPQLVYTAKVTRVTGQQVLYLCIYRPQSRELLLRYFFTKSAWMGIKGDGQRTEATLEHMTHYYGTDLRGDFHGSRQDRDAICKFLGVKPEPDTCPIKLLGNYQVQAQKAAVEAKRRAIYKQIDDAMNCIKPLPEDIDKWVWAVPLHASRYIYYHYAKGRKIQAGFCTACRQHVELDSPRHNEEIRCPNCNELATAKAAGRCTRTYWDESAFLYVQKTLAGYAIRVFEVKAIYSNVTVYKSGNKRRYDYTVDCEIKLAYFERIRELRDTKAGKSMVYEWENLFQQGYRWGKGKQGRLSGWHSDYPVYINAEEVLAGTPGQYFPIREYCTTKTEYGISNILAAITYSPALEYLHKMGLRQLVKEVFANPDMMQEKTCPVNYQGKNIREVLGVEKHDLPFLVKVNISHDQLKVFHWLRRRKESNAQEIFNEIRTIVPSIWRDLPQVLEYTTAAKAIGYLKRQYAKKNKRYNTIQYVLTEWRDYIRDCKELGYELTNEFVLFPRNLPKAHDETHLLAERQRSNKLYPSISKDYEKLMERYGFERDGLLIRPPHDGAEITAEGHNLHHCVSSYIERVARGETIILFIRQVKSPEASFYTLECRDGRIIQCRGMRNQPMTPEVKAFVTAWEQEVLQKKPNINIAQIKAPVVIAG